MNSRINLNEAERAVISKFWMRDPDERKNMLDVMTDFNCAVDLLENMAKKGILDRVGSRFYKLSQKTINYLLDAEK